jgi:hypothetical protein
VPEVVVPSVIVPEVIEASVVVPSVVVPAAAAPMTAEIGPELAAGIAAPQYGIGLQLFDAIPDATLADEDRSSGDDGRKA